MGAVSKFTGGSRPTKFAWTLFLCCFISNVLAGQVSTLMSVYLPNVLDSLMHDRAGDAEAVIQVETYISSIFLVGWTLGGFGWGLIGDHIGRLRSFTLSLACIGLFTWLVYFVPSWEMLV